MERYPIYKGLEKPLSYKGLKGKFIGWAIGSLVAGILIGGIVSAVINVFLGLFLSLLTGLGLFFLTLYHQKKGLYSKRRDRGVFIHQSKFKL